MDAALSVGMARKNTKKKARMKVIWSAWLNCVTISSGL
jgi:hypothetical protein